MSRPTRALLLQPVRMTSISESVRRRGGLAATFQLLHDGHTRRGLQRALQAGSVLRVRQGWYALQETDPRLLEGTRVGGRLTALSSLAFQGFWTHPDENLHVAVPPHHARLRSRHDKSRRLSGEARPRTCVHWRHGGSGSPFNLDPIDSLEDAMLCQDPVVVTAAGDSVLFRRPELTALWKDLVLAAPASHRRYLDQIDGVCESGTESVLWFHTRGWGLPLFRQQHIAGVGRVDFRLGRALIVEVDGAAYHTDPAAFERDRHRDALLSALGYRVLRFSYFQVMFAWPEVEAALVGALLRGDHL
jgi:very-short-patch-repair endonuclease